MMPKLAAIVRGRDGLVGVVESFLGPADEESESAAIRLEDGRRIILPADLLMLQADGSYAMELSGNAVQAIAVDEVADRPAHASRVTTPSEERAEPAVAEPTHDKPGRIRLQKTVRITEQILDQPTLHDEVEIERVPIGRVVEGPVPTREEGDVLIIPILEEVLVVETRLILKEELRITRRKVEQRSEQTVTLRTEEVTVVPEEAGGAPSERSPTPEE